MIDINKLRQLTQAATPGPWVATTVVTSVGVCHKVGPFPGKTIEHPPRHACMYVDYDSADNPADCEIFANAAFIAAANPAAISELLDRLESAERERDELLEACETFVEWLGREESGFARAGNKRDTPEGERAWRDWYNENLRLCALAQEQARAAIARATGEQP